MKKIIISSDILSSVLEKLALAVNPNHVLPALANMQCKVTKNEIELIASDLELTISVKCDAETSGEPFDFLLPVGYLKQVLSKADSAPVEIEHPSTRKAKIICHRDREEGEPDVYELNSLDRFDDFPKMPSVPKGNTLVLDQDFIGLLTKAMHTCSKDEMRPSMTRACLDIKPTGIELVSTDTHCLYLHKIPGKGVKDEQIHFSQKLAKALKGLETLETSWTDKTVCFKSGRTTIWCTRFQDKYPDYKVVIPNNEPNLTVDREKLINLLNKACLSSLHNKATLFNLKEVPGVLHSVTDDPEYERKIRLSVPCEYTGDTADVLLNAKKLQILMDQVDVEQVKLHIYHPTKAVLISSDEDKDYLGLIMPIKN